MAKNRVITPKVEVIENRPESDSTPENERFFSSPNTPVSPSKSKGKEVSLKVPVRLLIREKKYKSAAQMQKVMEKYFNDCDSHSEPYTVEGLSLACGFSSTTTLANYGQMEGYEEFHELVKRAKLKILNQRVGLAMKGKLNPVLFIFLSSNNNPQDYKRDPDGKGPAGWTVNSFLSTYEKPKDNEETDSERGDQDALEADAKAG